MKVLFSIFTSLALILSCVEPVEAQSTDEARQAILRLIKLQEESLNLRLSEIDRLNNEINETREDLEDARFNRNLAKVTLGAGVVTTLAGLWFARHMGGSGEWAVNIPRGLVVAGLGGVVAAGSGVYLLTATQVRDLKLKLSELEESLEEERESLEEKKLELLEIKKKLGVE